MYEHLDPLCEQGVQKNYFFKSRICPMEKPIFYRFPTFRRSPLKGFLITLKTWMGCRKLLGIDQRDLDFALEITLADAFRQRL